jgi:hypothetical protein
MGTPEMVMPYHEITQNEKKDRFWSEKNNLGMTVYCHLGMTV